jgi:iron complex outermembrane receptor protein
VVGGYGLMDISLGLGRTDGRFDISVIAKNLFNTQYRYPGWTSWIPSTPRWWGLQVRAKI